MDIDTVRRAVTEEDKKKHCEAGKCFECSRIGHMARNCPNRKERQTLARDKSGKFQKSKQKKKKFQPHSFIRAIKEVDSDDEDLEEDPQLDEEETEKPLPISELATQTSKFTTEQHDEWVQEMKKNGVDF
jgi:Zinc knuckle